MMNNGNERMVDTIKTIKIKGMYVIGYKDGQHVLYKNGEIVYKGDTIIYVGNAYKGEVDETWLEASSVISPGFIDLDADIDTDHALLDIGLPDTDAKFVMGNKFRTMHPFTEKDFQTRQRFSIAQLIKNGITTALPITGENFYEWNHSLEECKIMEQVAKEMGIRIYIGPSFKSRVLPDDADDKVREKRSVEEALAYCEANPRNDANLINAFVNPCQINVTSLETLKTMARYAQKEKMPYRIHACEAIREWQHTLKRYGKTTIELFYKEGMLFNQFIIPHAITATNNELKLLAKTGTSIVNTPLADANFGTALFAFDKYRYYGVNHTMGTDAQPTDMLRNMRMAWDLDRLCWRRKFFSTYSDEGSGEILPMLPDEPIYPKTSANHIFDAATLNGARALDRTDIGRLAEGAKADIIVIDLHDISIGPYQDPIRTIINACNGNHVKHTIVNGKVLMKDRVLLGWNESEILSDAQETFERYLQLYQDFDQANREVEEMFPSSYEVII